MTQFETILASNTWWGEERIYQVVGTWHDRWGRHASGIRLSQWEQARRVGEKAATCEDFLADWNDFLWREAAEADAPVVYDRQTGESTVQRGIAKRYPDSWGSKGFAESLFEVIQGAARLESVGRGEAAEKIIERIELQQDRNRQSDLLRLRQARHFVNLLVGRVKAECALQGTF